MFVEWLYEWIPSKTDCWLICTKDKWIFHYRSGKMRKTVHMDPDDDTQASALPSLTWPLPSLFPCSFLKSPPPSQCFNPTLSAQIPLNRNVSPGDGRMKTIYTFFGESPYFQPSGDRPGGNASVVAWDQYYWGLHSDNRNGKELTDVTVTHLLIILLQVFEKRVELKSASPPPLSSVPVAKQYPDLLTKKGAVLRGSKICPWFVYLVQDDRWDTRLVRMAGSPNLFFPSSRNIKDRCQDTWFILILNSIMFSTQARVISSKCHRS